MEKKKEENRKWRTSLGRRRGWWEWVNGALESSAEEQSEISSNFPLIFLFVLTITMDGCNDKTGEKAGLGLASSSIFTSCELRKRFSEGFHFKELVMILQMMMERKRQMGGSGGWLSITKSVHRPEQTFRASKIPSSLQQCKQSILNEITVSIWLEGNF